MCLHEQNSELWGVLSRVAMLTCRAPVVVGLYKII